MRDTPARRALAALSRPVRDYLDRRLGDVHRHIDHRADAIEARLQSIEDVIARLGTLERLDEAVARVSAVEELSETLRRFAAELAAQAEQIAARYEALLDATAERER